MLYICPHDYLPLLLSLHITTHYTFSLSSPCFSSLLLSLVRFSHPPIKSCCFVEIRLCTHTHIPHCHPRPHSPGLSHSNSSRVWRCGGGSNGKREKVEKKMAFSLYYLSTCNLFIPAHTQTHTRWSIAGAQEKERFSCGYSGDG
jgi:hypothetical protein